MSAVPEAMSYVELELERRRATTSAPARQVGPLPAARTAAIPSWIRVVERIHTSAFSLPVVALDAAVVLAAALGTGTPPTLAATAVVAVVVAFTAGRVYAPRGTLETQGIFWYLSAGFGALAAVVATVMTAAAALGENVTDAVRVVATVALSIALVRAVTWAVIVTARRNGAALHPTLIVGAGATARLVAQKLREYPEAGLRPLGSLCPDGMRDEGSGIGLGALSDDLPALIRHAAVEHVVLVPEGNSDAGIATCLDLCDGLDVDFSLLPPLSELYLHPTLVTQIGGVPLIPLGRVARTRRAQPGKRLFDIVLASLLLLVAAPVMLATALVIWLGDRGPILYRQRRVGQGGQPFEMLKFRSMVVGADRLVVDLREQNVTDGLLFKVERDPRVTAIGRIIRRLSIDELPQLINVVRGDMSLVGPRPLPVDPDDFGALDGKRHSVLPGITGYWQIAGGNGLSYQEMVKLDLSYIQNWSLWLDIRILMRTVPALLHRHGPS